MVVYIVFDQEDDGYRYIDAIYFKETDAKARSLVLHGTEAEYEDVEVI